MDNDKILITYCALSSGEYCYAGMEKMLMWLGNALSDNGFDVTVCTMYDKKRSEKYKNTIRSIELGIPYFHNFLFRNLVSFIWAPVKLYRIIKSDSYKYVVNFGDTTFFYVVLLRKLCHFTLVTSERGDPFQNTSVMERFRRYLVKYSDIMIFQTEEALSFYKGELKNKAFVIPNSVEIPKERWGDVCVERRIAYVGRIDFVQKRIDILVRAFEKVLEKYPDYVLDIYGSGETEKLKLMIKESGILSNVVVHGVVSDVNARLLRSEMFILTSDFEGIPNALLEAMALGIPVVATDCSPGGASMLIQNYKNGIIVGRGDVEKIADGMLYYIRNKDEAMRMGRNARESVRRFESANIICMWSAIFS